MIDKGFIVGGILWMSLDMADFTNTLYETLKRELTDSCLQFGLECAASD